MVSYKKQLDEATKALEVMKVESIQIKEEAKRIVLESRGRVAAAEALIEQLNKQTLSPLRSSVDQLGSSSLISPSKTRCDFEKSSSV